MLNALIIAILSMFLVIVCLIAFLSIDKLERKYTTVAEKLLAMLSIVETILIVISLLYL